MSAPDATRAEESGYEALRSGDWDMARDAFTAALSGTETPSAIDGLGRALWWLGEVEEAIAHRERAYAHLSRAGGARAAARVALWLSREYDAIYANEPAASGWLARAERLLRDLDPGSEHGLLALGRAQRSLDPAEAAIHAREALELGRRCGDPDVELLALARLGLEAIRRGRFEEGISALDEAMAAVTGGEASDLDTIGQVCCQLVVGCELTGDLERFSRWSELIDGFMRKHNRVALFSFCGACCGEMLLAGGRIDAAETELLESLQAAERTGQKARCVEPAARLAEIRTEQGRLEEADELLAGLGVSSESVRARARLHQAREEHAAASALLARRIGQLGEVNLLAAPLLSLLVESRVAQGELVSAAEAVVRLDELAGATGHGRTGALAELAAGRVAMAAGEPGAAQRLERAVETFSRLRLMLDASIAQLELARALEADHQHEAAIAEAQAAAGMLDRLGAVRERDTAAALVRRLGGKARTGPRNLGELTRRETEVLRLLGEGLTNAELASRLFITTKTAGHHVSNILAKLEVRNRTEAAAFAQRWLPPERGAPAARR